MRNGCCDHILGPLPLHDTITLFSPISFKSCSRVFEYSEVNKTKSRMCTVPSVSSKKHTRDVSLPLLVVGSLLSPTCPSREAWAHGEKVQIFMKDSWKSEIVINQVLCRRTTKSLAESMHHSLYQKSMLWMPWSYGFSSPLPAVVWDDEKCLFLCSIFALSQLPWWNCFFPSLSLHCAHLNIMLRLKSGIICARSGEEPLPRAGRGCGSC